MLEASFDRHRQLATNAWEVFDDRRTLASVPRVSVVVSLYNAAPKLNAFLASLACQTLFRRGEAELILVDSGSPANEYAVLTQRLSQSPLSVVYARTDRRETIQAAWNRGLSLAQGEFICFLGVDEFVHPQALQRLCDELEAKRSVDWIQANAIVTAVNGDGEYRKDVAILDRTGYDEGLVYLETGYLSWVGALQRRSMYARVGFYDPSFRAAGDTEFKNRVLPYVHTAASAETLGLYRNYPDDRATENPRAEIEDLRAWYLHRTPAGVEYSLRQHGVEEAWHRLRLCFGYRKSFDSRLSSDIEYAFSLASYIAQQSKRDGAQSVLEYVRQMRDVAVRLDTAQSTSAARSAWMVATALRQWHLAYRGVRSCALKHCPERFPATPFLFHDNRFEQHNNVW